MAWTCLSPFGRDRLCRGEWARALDHIERSLRADTDNLSARNLQAIVLRRVGRNQEANEILSGTRALDPLDICSRLLADGAITADGQRRLDLAFDLLRSGLLEEALS